MEEEKSLVFRDTNDGISPPVVDFITLLLPRLLLIQLLQEFDEFMSGTCLLDEMTDDFTYTTNGIILRVKEGLAQFGNHHAHYFNEPYRTSLDLVSMLLSIVPGTYKEIDPDSLPADMVHRVSMVDGYSKMYYWQLNGQFDHTSINKRKVFSFKGEHESRPFFSYHNLQAVATKSYRPSRGLVCPSMLCDVKGSNGELVDSGLRLMRIFMTRCATHEIWGLVYSLSSGEIQLVKDLFRSTAKQVAVNFVPFDLDAPNK